MEGMVHANDTKCDMPAMGFMTLSRNMNGSVLPLPQPVQQFTLLIWWGPKPLSSRQALRRCPLASLCWTSQTSPSPYSSDPPQHSLRPTGDQSTPVPPIQPKKQNKTKKQRQYRIFIQINL